MPLPLETERLVLRVAEPADVEPLFAVFGDVAAMQYISSGADPDRAATRRRVEWMMNYQRQHSMSLWSVVERASGTVIGDCGLRFLEQGPLVEVGYRLGRKHWHKGYATEAARAAVEFGFTELGLGEIVAICQPENLGSQNVMRKLGMTLQGPARYYDTDVNLSRLTRDAWSARPSTHEAT